MNINNENASTSQTSEASHSFAMKLHSVPTKETEILSVPSQLNINNKSPIKDSVVDTILESIAPSACNYSETSDEHKKDLKGNIL